MSIEQRGQPTFGESQPESEQIPVPARIALMLVGVSMAAGIYILGVDPNGSRLDKAVGQVPQLTDAQKSVRLTPTLEPLTIDRDDFPHTT